MYEHIDKNSFVDIERRTYFFVSNTSNDEGGKGVSRLHGDVSSNLKQERFWREDFHYLNYDILY